MASISLLQLRYSGNCLCRVYTDRDQREPPLSQILPFDPATMQKEWGFLCACASPASTPDEINSLTEGLNWDALLKLADEHSVQGLLAKRLSEIEPARIPVAARERLQSRIRAQHLFALSLTADLFRILQGFSDVGINTALVKGPILSLLAYDDPSVRSYVDLDLLVADRDIQRASQKMLEIGFQSEVPVSAICAGKIPGEYLFRRPGTQRVVELHTEHSFRYYPKQMPINDLFARRRQVLLDGREVPGLSLEDEFVLTCVHGAKHFWERLM